MLNQFLLCVMLGILHLPLFPFLAVSARKHWAMVGDPSQSLQDFKGEHKLKGGEKHVYQLKPKANEYLKVVVEQKGIDVVVTLFAPDQTKLLEIDTQVGTQGSESVFFIADKAGDYRLEVAPVQSSAPEGKYEARIVEFHPATKDDFTRIAAQKVMDEASRLQDLQQKDAYLQAIEKYQEGANHWHALGDKYQEAIALNEIGVIYNSLGQIKKAMELIDQALALRREVGDRSGESSSLNNLGAMYFASGDPRKALEYYGQALVAKREAGDQRGEANTLFNIGLLNASVGDFQKAVEYQNLALVLARKLGNRRVEANVLDNLGYVHNVLGNQRQSLEYLMDSLRLNREIGTNRLKEGQVLLNIGAIWVELGEIRKALGFFEQALKLRRDLGDQVGEALTLQSLGIAYSGLGENQKALEYLAQALKLQRALGNRRDQAASLSATGYVYQTLGEPLKALDYFSQGLEICRATNNQVGESKTLTNIGSVYVDIGNHQQALEFFTQALSLNQKLGNPRWEAYTLTNIGSVYSQLGNQPRALEYFAQALPLRRTVADRTGEATTLHNMGVAYHQTGQTEKALEYFNQGLQLRRAVEDRSGEANSLYSIARINRNLGQLDTAKTNIEQALNLVEQIRLKVEREELRASYLATVQTYYEFYVDLLVQMHAQNPQAGYDQQALHIIERARARSLLDLLTESRVDIRQGVDAKLLDTESDLKNRLTSKLENLTKLLNRKHTAEQETTAKKEIDGLTEEFRQIQAEIRRQSPHYAALTQPQPLTAREIQTQVLDANTLLLEYWLGAECSYVCAVTSTTLTFHKLPDRAEIEKAAQRVRTLLTERNQHPAAETRADRHQRLEQTEQVLPEAAQALSQMILAPVARELGTKRLLIAADGALQYLPFGALPRPETEDKKLKNTNKRIIQLPQPLIVSHEIVMIPSASTIAVLRKETAGRPVAEKELAVLADPVFSLDDVRVKSETDPQHPTPDPELSANSRAVLNRILENAQDQPDSKLPKDERAATEDRTLNSLRKLGIPRLIFTREEANQISTLTKKPDNLTVLDFSVNRELVVGPELSRYRYLHFATHGYLDTERPELSALILSLVDEKGVPQDGFLRALEVYNLNLPAELVVLSACDTGLGKSIKGEGLVGLTRGFMYAGTRRIVVSLWSVSDQATSELMVKFYRKMLQQNERPAAALRAAQIEMWKSKKWHSPFYWAPFVIQGEWR